MKSRKTKSPTITRIEIDEKTNEPIIVEETESDFSNSNYDNRLPTNDFIEASTDKDIGKQLFLQKMIGSTKEDFNFKDEKSPIKRRQKIFKVVFTFLFAAFVIAVLGFTFYNDFIGGVISGDKEYPSLVALKGLFLDDMNWRFFLYAALALMGVLFTKGLKLSVMTKSLTKKWHFRTCMETGIIGTYYNAVTPFAAGGQPFEVNHLSKHGVHGGAASAIPVAAYFLNQIAFVACGITAMVVVNKFGETYFHPNVMNIYNPVVLTMGIVGAVCCLFVPALIILIYLMPRLCVKLVKVFIILGGKLKLLKDPKKSIIRTIRYLNSNANALKKIIKKPLTLLTSLILAFAENLCVFSITFFIAKAFGFSALDAVTQREINVFSLWGQMSCMTVLLLLAISFIPTPGNAGAADLSFYAMFSSGIVGAGMSFTANTVARLFSFYSYIIIGFIFAIIKKRSDNRLRALGLMNAKGDRITDLDPFLSTAPPKTQLEQIEIATTEN